MNKNLLIALGGLGVVAIIIYSINLPKKNSGTTTENVSTTNKEISIDQNICNAFPKDFVSGALGKTIIKTEAIDRSTTHVCQYYVDENNFVTLRLNNLNVENQKKGQEALGRKISTNNKINMDHFVVLQDNGLINEVILVINPNSFIAIDRTSTKAASETEIIDFAAKIAEKIKK
jgi:hypothetical protein